MRDKIMHWYRREYPTDDLGMEINSDITFQDLFDTLDHYVDVYRLLGVNDSVIRTRCFERLADIIGTDYDYIFDQWLKGRDIRE